MFSQNVDEDRYKRLTTVSMVDFVNLKELAKKLDVRINTLLLNIL